MKKLLILILLIPNICIGAVSISSTSTPTDGQALTISGSGFGTNTQLLKTFCDFESATSGKYNQGISAPSDGSEVSTYQEDVDSPEGSWCQSWRNTDTNVIFTNSGQRTGSTYSSYHTYDTDDDSDDNGEVWSPLIWNGDESKDTTGQYVYTSFWAKTNFFGALVSPVADVQFKFHRFTGYQYNTYGSITNSMWYDYSFDPPTPEKMETGWGCDTCSAGSPGVDAYSLENAQYFPDDQWVRYEMEVKLCTSGATGYIKTRVLIPSESKYINVYTDTGDSKTIDIDNLRTDGTYYLRDSRYGLGVTNLCPGACPSTRVEMHAYMQVDDIYFATTIARVEISDSATYEQATWKENLIPTSWSDTEVQATLNTRGHTGDVYLWVTDTDGSQGSYVITIGSESQSIASTASVIKNSSSNTTFNYSETGATLIKAE